MQAGARDYPEPPFRKQHQAKPGHETEVEPAPMYDAPYYLGSKKLDGKVVVVNGPPFMAIAGLAEGRATSRLLSLC